MGDTLQEGKLLLKRGEYEKAANIFQEFLQQRVDEFGEMANECAEIYLLYGKALYEIGKVETDTALRQILNIATSKESSDTKSMEVLETIKTGTFIPTVALGGTNNNNEVINNNEISENDGEEGDENETETFELAWQWLDLARIIYSKMIESDPHSLRITELKNSLAECYLTLGRIGLETDSPTSLEDLQSCLKIQLETLDAHSAKLSFTQYQIAIAHQLSYQYENSLISLQDALSRLEAEEEEEEEEEEIEETIEDLISKIKEKIEEVQKLMVPKKSEDGVQDTKEENVVDMVRTMIKTSFDEVKPVTQNTNNLPVRNLGVFGKPNATAVKVNIKTSNGASDSNSNGNNGIAQSDSPIVITENKAKEENHVESDTAVDELKKRPREEEEEEDSRKKIKVDTESDF